MSLIIDINPVPWKILDLVRARILKNRAKKAKKGMDWSKETMRREMALQPGPLSRRKRDEPSFIPGSQVDVGVGWLHIGRNHTVITDEQVNTETEIPYEHPEEGLIGPWTVGDTYTKRDETTGSASASLEFVVTVGTRSGERWKQFRHSLTFTGTGIETFEETWTKINGPNDIFGNPTNFIEKSDRTSVNGTSNFIVGLWWNLLPAGQSDMILVVSIAQYLSDIAYEQINIGPVVYSRNSFTVQNTTHTCFLVTESDVVELTQPLPAFMQKKIDSVPAEYAAGNTTYGVINNVNSLIPARLAVPQSAIGVYQINHPNPYVATELGSLPPTTSPYRIDSKSVSSVVYESIAPDGTFSAVSAQQAKTSYAEYSGIAEIPVLGYERDDPLVASTPTTERGSFGIIPDASVTEPVTTEMLAAGLDDELEQFPGPNAANQPEPVQMVVAYDYHGGSYCRDRLTQLGFNL